MIGPRDKDLRWLYDALYPDDDQDQFSERSDQRLRREFVKRYARGNVSMQNGWIAEGDFNKKLSTEVSRLLSKLKKFEP